MIIAKRVCVVFCLAIHLALFAGCQGGSEGSVSGTVTVDGTPVSGLEVLYTPIDPAIGGSALAYTQEGGKYTIIRGRGNTTIPTGEYKVAIKVYEEDLALETPRVKLPNNYTSPSETELRATVAGGQNTIDFDLESAN
ncbi:MAG: hypothetical protein WDZ51_19065 [Pirellulaceae bacterium]